MKSNFAGCSRSRLVKNGLWRWWAQLILLGLFFLPVSLLQVRQARSTPALSLSSQGLLSVSAVQFAIFAGVFGLACFLTRPTREDLLLHWHWSAPPLGLGYSLLFRVGLAILALGAVLVAMAAGWLHSQDIQKVAQANAPRIDRIVSVHSLQVDRTYFWLTITVVSFLVAGLREEFWRVGVLAALRRLAPRWFGSKRGQYFAIVLIAIGFGAAHFGQGLVAAIMAGILGVFLGIIMVYHRSVWPAVFAHGCFDATTFALIPLFHAQLGR